MISTFDRIRFRSRANFLTWEAIGVTAFASIAATAVAAGVSAYTAVAASDNAHDTAKYNAEVQENAAKDAQQRGAIAAAEHQDKVRRMIGTQMATAGANGLLTTTGTPLDIMTDTAGMGKLDALRILDNASRQAKGLDDQATLTRIEGDNAQSAGYWNAAGSVLGAASKVATTSTKG